MNTTLAMARIKSCSLGLFLGAFLGGITGYFQPTWWEGRALMLLGDFTESRQTVVERLKMESFKESVRARAGIAVNVSIKLAVTPGFSNTDNVVIVTTTTESEDSSRQVAEAVVAELRQRHDKLQQHWLAGINAKHAALLAALAHTNGSFIVSAESFGEPVIRQTQLLEPVSAREVGLLFPIWRAWLFGALLGLLFSWAWCRFSERRRYLSET